MAMGLRFRAVAHDRHGSPSAKFLEQSQRELLPVVLDEAVCGVSGSALEQLAPIVPAELGPSHVRGSEPQQQPFAGAEIGHPCVV